MQPLLAHCALFLLFSSGIAHAQLGTRNVPVVDATNDRVLYFDDLDGQLSSFSIDLAAAGAVDPFDVLTISLTAVWVADRTTDSIYRFDIGSSLSGTISTGLDDIRDMTWFGNRVYVANRGSANGAPGPSIVIFDFNGNNLGSFPVSDPEGVHPRAGGLLVGNLAGHDIDHYALDGTFLGKFHDSDGLSGIDLPGQFARSGCRGELLCAGGGNNSGLYEYDSSGNQVGYYAHPMSVRGVCALRGGNVLFTDANGVHMRDVASGTTITVLSGIDAGSIGQSDPELPTAHEYCVYGPLACPCGQAPAGCTEGCLNSLGVGVGLEGGGSTSLAADTMVLVAHGLPSSAPVLFFQGTGMQNGGSGSVFGDGLRCVSGSIIRLATKFASNGVARYPQAGDEPISVRGLVASPGVRTYQAWYRNAANFCTPSTFNLSNGWYVVWNP